MKLVVLLSLILLVAAIQGCGISINASIEEDKLAKQFNTAKDSANVYVYRPGHFVGSGVVPNILINGRIIGPIGSSEFIMVNLKPDTYQLSAQVDTTLFPSKLFFSVKGSENVFIKMDFMSASKTFVIADRDEAVKTIKGLTLVKSNDYFQ